MASDSKPTPHNERSSKRLWIRQPRLFLIITALSAAVKHMQHPYAAQLREQLGCDTLCNGQMSSAKSAIGLVGSVVVGRLSDVAGRKAALWVALFGQLCELASFALARSVFELWLGLVPSALLSKQLDVGKAMVADFTEGQSVETRSQEQGLLGMAAGIGILATALAAAFPTRYEVAALATAFSLVSGVVTMILPFTAVKRASSNAVRSSPLASALHLQCVRSRAGLLLISLRALMGLAFHIYLPIFQDSLRRRFDFKPKDFSKLIAFMGTVYALSQGVLSKRALLLFKGGQTPVLVCCCLGLASGRVVATVALRIVWVYVGGFIVVASLGVMNSAISAASSYAASQSEFGGFFGVLSAVESCTGIVGPLMGGLLWRHGGDEAVLGAVVVAYIVALLVLLCCWHSSIERLSRPKTFLSPEEKKA